MSAPKRWLPLLLAVASPLAFGVSAPAEEQAVLVYDDANHMVAADVAATYCQGRAGCAVQIQYLDCRSGTCLPSAALPDTGPVAHETHVGKSLVAQLRRTEDGLDAPFRIYDAVGAPDTIANWLAQPVEAQEPGNVVVRRVHQLGIRVIVGTGGSRGPDQACSGLPGADLLRTLDVSWIAAAGNQSLNGFASVGGVMQQNAIYCGPNVVSVADERAALVDDGGRPCSEEGVSGCRYYPLYHKSNFHPLHAPFATSGCWKEQADEGGDCGADAGTSFAAPAVAGHVLALYRRHPALRPAQAEALLKRTPATLSTAAYGNQTYWSVTPAVTLAALAQLCDNPAKMANGLYSNNHRSGNGFFFQDYASGHHSVAWYTYDAEGMPTWYTIQDPYPASTPHQDACWTPRIYRTTFAYGANFSLPGTPNSTVVGRARAVVSDGRVGLTFAFDNGIRGAQALDRVNFAPSDYGHDYTGTWGASDMSNGGWGYSMYSIGNQHFIAAYFFDRAGQPRWAITAPQASRSDAQLAGTLSTYRNTGRCPGCAWPYSRTDYPDVGTFSTANYGFERYLWGSWMDTTARYAYTHVAAFPGLPQQVQWQVSTEINRYR